MLHNISWLSFIRTLATFTILYYIALISLLFRKEAKALFLKGKRLLLLIPSAALAVVTYAQDPNTGINQANTLIRGMFDTGTQLMYAIGAVLALIGAVRTFREWNAGHQQEAYRAATGWFGSCLFLVIVATVIKSFFAL